MTTARASSAQPTMSSWGLNKLLQLPASLSKFIVSFNLLSKVLRNPPEFCVVTVVFHADPPRQVHITTNVETPFLENKQGVEFTCTTEKMNPNAVIFEWFINGAPVNSGSMSWNYPGWRVNYPCSTLFRHKFSGISTLVHGWIMSNNV